MFYFLQMFVRLFVDENLDRMIPISKQPKEKIQAIIDSCTRQFPEFSERARKRIRTYLKSCRRNKKTREGWEPTASRPTPAHLTSVQAEQILAMACENESLNAKRMRIGLDPISQTAPLVNVSCCLIQLLTEISRRSQKPISFNFSQMTQLAHRLIIRSVSKLNQMQCNQTLYQHHQKLVIFRIQLTQNHCCMALRKFFF